MYFHSCTSLAYRNEHRNNGLMKNIKQQRIVGEIWQMPWYQVVEFVLLGRFGGQRKHNEMLKPRLQFKCGFYWSPASHDDSHTTLCLCNSLSSRTCKYDLCKNKIYTLVWFKFVHIPYNWSVVKSSQHFKGFLEM